MSTLQAGAAVAEITPPPGKRMDGYGGRTQPSQGVHDPLFARVLVLDDGSGPDGRCAIVSCDLLGMHPWITAQVRRRAAEACDIPPQGVVVAATHDHAGPMGLRGGMFSYLDEPLAAEVVDRIAAAIASAQGQRRPAVLKLGQVLVDTVSMNRRHPEGPIDPALRLLLVDGAEGRPIASLLNFACHATVLNATNLLISAEFPGVACRLLQGQTGAPCVYLNGACGDVNPLWIRQDFDSVERVGQIVGGQALRLIGELRTLGPGQRAHNIRWDEFPERPVPGRIVPARVRSASREVELPLRPFLPDEEYGALIQELEARAASLPQGSQERRQAMAQLTRRQSERWAALWARRQGEARAQRTEAQALSLGEGLALLALPGEFFVETGNAIRAASGIPDLLLACYANDYVGYVIPPAAYEEGGYEAGVTFCRPEAEGMVRQATLELLRQVSA